MVDKDKEHDKDKREQEKREHDKRAGQPGHIDNRDQDPNDPANKTPSKDVRPLAERDHIEGAVYSTENLMTEQEKDAGNETMGVGPITPPEVEPVPVETIQEQGIGPRTPYPTGDPPPPSESLTIGQGIKGVTDKPVTKPDEAKGLGGAARRTPMEQQPHRGRINP